MGALDPKNRRNLGLRVLSGIVLFPIAVWLTYLGGLPFALLAGAAAAVGAAELVLLFGSIGVGEAFGVLVAGGIPVVAAYAERGEILPDWCGLALSVATVVLFTTFLFRLAPIESIPRALALVAFSWLYCGFLVATLVAVRIRFGVGWVILAFVVTWANDTAAYFAGHSVGKHRLFERISPKKTWEGFAGGIAGSIAGALLCRWILARWPSVALPEAFGAGAGVVVGLGAAIVGPLGDLAESMLKRAAGKKDSGRTIPGHGGLLDRIDALLFVAPWVYACAAWLARGA